MTSKANLKLLKEGLSHLEFAEGYLEDFVYYTGSDACSNISSNIHEQIRSLKDLIGVLEEFKWAHKIILYILNRRT